MMETLKDWAFSLCLAIVAGEIMIMILPKSNTTKIFKFVLSTFFLGVIIFPFLGGSIELDIDLSSDIVYPATQNAQNLDSIVRSQMADQLEKVTQKYLKEKEVYNPKIQVQLIDQENATLFETTITLTSIDKPKAHTIQKELEKLLGTTVTLIFSDKDEKYNVNS